MEAAGADMKTRGAVADEFLQVLKTIWTTNPVKFEGKFFRVPESAINAKPVQKPHPPIYMAAFAPAALKRVATAGIPWESRLPACSRCSGRSNKWRKKLDAIPPSW
jgi:alkanesulfonate monooxygenase SsuD/methylene tetrahydromethanopterin reductase-like flavin-dependent oxidoreductase (luciferase family)